MAQNNVKNNICKSVMDAASFYFYFKARYFFAGLFRRGEKALSPSYN